MADPKLKKYVLSHIQSCSLEKHCRLVVWMQNVFGLENLIDRFLDKVFFQIRLKKLHNLQPVYKNDTCPFSYWEARALFNCKDKFETFFIKKTR